MKTITLSKDLRVFLWGILTVEYGRCLKKTKFGKHRPETYKYQKDVEYLRDAVQFAEEIIINKKL